MKYLTVSIIIITCLMLVINAAFADPIPTIWARVPPGYKSFEASPFFFLAFYPVSTFLILLIDFLYLLISTSILDYFFLKYENIKILKILLGTLIGTIIGAIIDLISEEIAININHIVIKTHLLEVYELDMIYYASIFLISFLLLEGMYSIIFNKLYKVGFNKKAKLVTTVLAIITNPIWFVLLYPVVNLYFPYI